jgi:hypothetical protein
MLTDSTTQPRVFNIWDAIWIQRTSEASHRIRIGGPVILAIACTLLGDWVAVPGPHPAGAPSIRGEG